VSNILKSLKQYASCGWLQRNLELDPYGVVHACCFQYSPAPGDVRGSVKLCQIKDDRFPAEEIIAARERIHAEIRCGTHHDCNTCPQLVVREWEVPDYLVSGLAMNVWTHCNLKCRYCFTTAPGFTHARASYDIEKVIADMLAGQHLDPHGVIVWGGGDISALPEFDRLALMFNEYPVFQEFKTSGFKFLRGVSEALSELRGIVEVSLDAGTRETYADFKGRDCYYEVVENVRRYRQLGRVKLKYIATHCNLNDADINGFVTLVDELRPESVKVTPEYVDSWMGRYQPEQIKAIARLINLLRQTGVPTIPQTDEEITQIFHNFHEQLKTELNQLSRTFL
jgi:sulfatase maturation enzyme AslB (radical SAM superfamily)